MKSIKIISVIVVLLGAGIGYYFYKKSEDDKKSDLIYVMIDNANKTDCDWFQKISYGQAIKNYNLDKATYEDISYMNDYFLNSIKTGNNSDDPYFISIISKLTGITPDA